MDFLFERAQDHGPCHAVDCLDKTLRVRNDAETVERMLGGQAAYQIYRVCRLKNSVFFKYDMK